MASREWRIGKNYSLLTIRYSHDPGKVRSGFPVRIMFKQESESALRFRGRTQEAHLKTSR
jgi:hypothetical protein